MARHVPWLLLVILPITFWLDDGLIKQVTTTTLSSAKNSSGARPTPDFERKEFQSEQHTAIPIRELDNFKQNQSLTTSISVPEPSPRPKKKKLRHDKGPLQTSRRPVLTLHIGPPKTGTTTIQWYAGTYEEQLRKNNIYYLGFYINKKKGEFNTHELCYACRQKKKPECENKWKELEKNLDAHFAANHDVFLSEEIFSDFKPQVEKDFLIPYLQPMLAKWKVKVLLSYRRFYEWVPSWYTQIYQPTSGHGTLLAWPDVDSKGQNHGGVIIPTIRKYFQKDAEKRYNQLLTNPEKWSALLKSNIHNESTDVFVFNMHQKDYASMPGTLEKDFFCQMLPDAKVFCEFIRKRNSTISMNPSSSKHLHYDLLAVEANNRGWINRNSTMSNKSSKKQGDIVTRHETRTALEDYATNKLGFTKVTDYELDCLSPNETQILLSWSLQLESKLSPGFFASAQGKSMLQRNFAQAVADQKFCSIHVDKTLQDKRWKTFFQSLTTAAKSD